MGPGAVVKKVSSPVLTDELNDPGWILVRKMEKEVILENMKQNVSVPSKRGSKKKKHIPFSLSSIVFWANVTRRP